MQIIDITSKIPQGNYSISRDGYGPECIVLHITGDSANGQAVGWFENSESKVSAHYVIEKNGDIIMCVNPMHKAYHCGIVKLPTAQIYLDKGSVNPNKYTIGIECVSSGEKLTAEQISSVKTLLAYLSSNYNIVIDRYHVIGHNELDSVTRRLDPISSYTVDEIIRKEVYIVTGQEALKVLADKGVINSVDYWVKCIDTVKNFEQLLINMATVLSK